MAQQVRRSNVPGGTERNAQTCRAKHFFVVKAERQMKQLLDVMNRLPNRILTGMIAEKNCKFIPRMPCHRVVRREGSVQPPRQRNQQLVTDVGAQAVIDPAETINIEQRHSTECGVLARSLCGPYIEDFNEDGACRHARERIVP